MKGRPKTGRCARLNQENAQKVIALLVLLVVSNLERLPVPVSAADALDRAPATRQSSTQMQIHQVQRSQLPCKHPFSACTCSYPQTQSNLLT